jgi:imidazolonepropionase
VRGARQLLTLHRHSGARRGGELADLGVIVDGSVLLHNGVIEAVGPTRRIENIAGARNARELDAAGRVVMPAFVDPHACLVPVPAYRQEATAKPVHALPATRLEAQADDLLKTMARHGTATVGALSGYGRDATGELKILRAMRARDRKPLDVVSILFIRGADFGRDAGLELLNCVARRKLASMVAVQCGEGAHPRLEAELFLHAARSLGLAVRWEMLREHDTELVEAAVNLHALSISTPGPYRAHEIEMLSDASTFAILLPERLSRTGLTGSARELIDSGALIALGSGLSPEVGATGSMQTVVQLACELLDMSLAEAISAATINAAWALGVGPHTGSLEHGKSGDLILLNASDYREIPLLAGTNLAHAMIKRGVILFKEDFPGWPNPA